MSEPREYTIQSTSADTDSIGSQLFRSFTDPAYREAHAEEYLNTFIALQIRTIREQRGWTQQQLGERCGGKAQGWISTLEDPNYGQLTLRTLKQIARAFDCILDVRFKSFLTHSDEQNHRYLGDMRVNSYLDDAAALYDRANVTSKADTSIDAYVLSDVPIRMAKANLVKTDPTANYVMGVHRA